MIGYDHDLNRCTNAFAVEMFFSKIGESVIVIKEAFMLI